MRLINLWRQEGTWQRWPGYVRAVRAFARINESRFMLGERLVVPIPGVGAFLPPPLRGNRMRPGDGWLPAVLALGTSITLLAAPWPQNLFLILTATAFIVALLKPAIGMGLLVLSVPIQSVGEHQLGSLHLTVTKAVLIGLITAWVLRTTTLRRGFRLGLVEGMFGLHVAVLALSIVNARDSAAWGSELYRWWSALVVYVIAITTIRDVRSSIPILVATIAGVAGTSLLGFYQVAAGLGPASFSVGGLVRAFSTFGQPNPFAGYLEVTVPLLAALAASWVGGPWRSQLRLTYGDRLLGASAAAAVMGLGALVLTQSRGGWIGMACGLAVVVWMVGGAVRWSAVGAGALVAIMVVATPVGARLASRLGESELRSGEGVQVTVANFAVQERLAHWRAGLEMVRRRPLLGVGAGNFSAVYREVTPVWRFRVSRGHAHNAYIHAAAQTGLTGLSTYLLFLGAVALRLRGALRAATDGPGRPLVIGAIGVTVAISMHNIFDYLHVLSLPVQLSAVWAIAGAASIERELTGAHVPGAAA